MAFLSQCADLYVHLHTVIAQTQRKFKNHLINVHLGQIFKNQ